MTDLYTLLGIPRDATAAQVRKAYRAKAKTAHPDTGGSEQEFHKLTTALEVLSDPVRRAHYDKTGEVGETPADNEMAETMNAVAGAFHRVIQQVQSGLRVPDIVDTMKRDLTNNIDAWSKQRDQAQTAIVQQEKFAKRFRRKKGAGPNMLEQLALALVAGNREIASKCQHEINAAGRALVFLADYEDAEAQGSALHGVGVAPGMAATFGRMW